MDVVLNNEEMIGEPIGHSTQEISEPIDFDGKDFKDAQKILEINARLNEITTQLTGARHQRAEIIEKSVGDNGELDVEDIINMNLERFKTPEEIQDYLKGDLNDENVQSRILSIFTDPDGIVLELNGEAEIDSEFKKFEFMRGLAIYFKQLDYYTEQIGIEQQKLEEAQREFDSNIASVLNPLKDNMLAYATYLDQKFEIRDTDTYKEKKFKKLQLVKAEAIRNGFDLKNLISLIQKNPKIKEHALADFHNEEKIKAIGVRYSNKLKTLKTSLNLYGLLSDDITGNIEYKLLPQGDYPAGLEGFTVFFIIRYLSMGLNNDADIYFHSSIYIAFNRLLKGELDEDVELTMKGTIKEFLSYFNE